MLKTDNDGLVICLNSGANSSYSTNRVKADWSDLDTTKDLWEKLDDDSKMKKVIEYWNASGLPEIYWED